MSAAIEKSKLHANYWNGLAITTIAIGVLPLFLETGATSTEQPDLVLLGIQLIGRLAFAIPLSLVFHVLAVRCVRNI